MLSYIQFACHHVGNQPGAVFFHKFDLAAGPVYGIVCTDSQLCNMPSYPRLLFLRRDWSPEGSRSFRRQGPVGRRR